MVNHPDVEKKESKGHLNIDGILLAFNFLKQKKHWLRVN
jgi:hypothetical protein